MGLQKKKNVIIVSVIIIISFILYQLYFFFAISSQQSGSRIILGHDLNLEQHPLHIRTKEDKYINHNGVLRGVLSANMPRYRPDKEKRFKCLTSEQYIPFEQINDDFCDCEDGTDEPSTSACVVGLYFCDTQINKQSSISVVPSSKVNDGICDCCDGSDEWLYSAKLLTQGSVILKRKYATKCLNIC